MPFLFFFFRLPKRNGISTSIPHLQSVSPVLCHMSQVSHTTLHQQKVERKSTSLQKRAELVLFRTLDFVHDGMILISCQTDQGSKQIEQYKSLGMESFLSCSVILFDSLKFVFDKYLHSCSVILSTPSYLCFINIYSHKHALHKHAFTITPIHHPLSDHTHTHTHSPTVSHSYTDTYSTTHTHVPSFCQSEHPNDQASLSHEGQSKIFFPQELGATESTNQ